MGKTKEDYVKDGLLHCGVCGKPKELNISLFGETKIVACLCDCGVAERNRKEAAWQEEQRMMRINDMRINSIHDRESRKCRFDNATMTKHLLLCQKYVENWDKAKAENIGLLMWGKVGNGKSFAAACIANALIDKDVPVLMTSFPAILSDQNNTMEIAKQMKEFDLVILDDLGAERQSQYALEKVFYIIDERYKSNKPLIVTTNQELSDMKQMRNGKNMDYSRIYDRILEMCVPMLFEQESRRLKTQTDKTKAAFSILT